MDLVKVLRYALVILVFLALPPTLSGNETKEEEKKKKQFGFVPLPVVAYTPETSLMLGLKGIAYYNRAPEKKDSVQDSIQVGGIYTLKKQFMGMVRTEFYPFTEKIMVTMFLTGNKAPEVFFGIGDDLDEDTSENYLKVDIRYRAFLGFALARGIYVGPAFDFWKMNVRNTKSGGMLDTSGIKGADGIETFGVGLRVHIDRKKGIHYPLGGFMTEVKALRYGTKESFYNIYIDHRHYFRIAGEHVIAVQALYNINRGEIPFQLMASLGGEEIMRGYYKGAYLDTCMLSAQVEYRFPIFWRFMGVAFFGVGNVAPGPFAFDPERTAFAGGLGLRIILDKREKIPIRFDAAVNREGRFNYYFSILQAF
jgi:hypothetical protein